MNIKIVLNMFLLPNERRNIELLTDELLVSNDLGEVTGGSTFQKKNGEVYKCEIYIRLKDESSFDTFLELIKNVSFARGSRVESTNKRVEIGDFEGLSLYFNAGDLSEEVYNNFSYDDVIVNLCEILGEDGLFLGTNIIDKYFVLYFYGKNFEVIKEKITPFLKENPLCEGFRIKRVCWRRYGSSFLIIVKTNKK